jgi:hypothetical protein
LSGSPLMSNSALTVRIAANDEHMLSTKAPHVGQPHGLSWSKRFAS